MDGGENFTGNRSGAKLISVFCFQTLFVYNPFRVKYGLTGEKLSLIYSSYFIFPLYFALIRHEEVLQQQHVLFFARCRIRFRHFC